MVYYFTSNVVSPPAFLYVGKDKVENEDLIKFGWEEDIWFHVDNLSSAHVYLRMQAGQTWDSIPNALVEDCAQLTKANSIEGNKKDNILVPIRQNPIINRLNKTKVEKFPDLRAEREEDQKEKRKVARIRREGEKAREREERCQRDEARWQKEHGYDDLMNDGDVAKSSNQDREEGWLDDFM